MNHTIELSCRRLLSFAWLLALAMQLLFVARISAADALQSAVSRAKRDTPQFGQWSQQPLSLPQDLVQLLAPLTLVELSPNVESRLRAIVAVASDEKTYRLTNDSDLTVVIDAAGLKASLARSSEVFAQNLATLRCFPDEGVVLKSSADIPPPQGKGGLPLKDEVAQRFKDKIKPLDARTEGGATTLTFCYCSQNPGELYQIGAIYQMTVTVSANHPTKLQTLFLGYAHFTGTR